MPLITLFHLEAFLFELQVPFDTLLELFVEELLDLLHLLVVILLNLFHRLKVLAFLQFLLEFKVIVALLKVGDVVVFLLLRLLLLLLVPGLVLS